METTTIDRPKKRRARDPERDMEALARARNGCSQNDTLAAVLFAERGIPVEVINPRENVLTFAAWRALGRTVKRGEHGIRVPVWIPFEKEVKKPDGTTEIKAGRYPRDAVLFHISQTTEL